MIKLICIGKIKESFIKDAISEYQKRLLKYVDFKIIELDDISIKEIDIVLKKEAEAINKVIKSNDYLIALDINGKQLDSIEFSSFIEKQMMINANITFIIGGSYGISQDILKRCDYLLSFSKLTFPHQLFRLIFVEQLYRAFRILHNESYHK